MTKFTLHITIYTVELFDQYNITVQAFYFLSAKRAKKFMEKHMPDWEGYRVTMGGEPLWLW